MKLTKISFILTLIVGTLLAMPTHAVGAVSFTEMAETGSIQEASIQAAPGLQPFGRTTKAITGYYLDPVAFATDAPGLVVENFLNANVPPGGVVGCGSPVSNGNPCFAPGGIADGLTIAASSGTNVVALGAGIVGNATPMVAADLFADSTILEFTNPDVYAVGLHLAVAGPPENMTIDIEAFDGTPLGTTTAPVGPAISFWGVASTTPIGKVTLTSPGGAGEVVETVQFGSPECGPADTETYDFESGLIDPAWSLTGIGHANQESAEVVDDAGNLELALTSDGATAYLGTDNAGFLYQELTGDFRVETDLDTSTMTTGKVWRKAGLMVRASLDHLDIRLLVMHAPVQGRLQFVARTTYGGPGNVKVAFEEAAPSSVRLAIQREGQVLSVEYSLDGGATWITPTTGLGGSVDIPALPATLSVGLATVSNNISVTSTANFDNVSICQEAP